MENKQTAVEWLWKALLDSGFEDIEDVEGFYYQALIMEKEQIINADLNGSYRTASGSNVKLSSLRVTELAQEYYNETYKK